MKVGIVGTGIAGLSAAIGALENNDQVTIFSKSNDFSQSASSLAQGGIVLVGEGDTSQSLYRDMLKASGGMINRDITKLFCTEASLIAKKILIEKVKVPFSRKNNQGLQFVQEAGHRRKRIIYSQDSTGKTIVTYLLAYLRKKSNVAFRPANMVIDLINIPHHSDDPLAVYEPLKCLGMYVYDEGKEKVKKFFFDKIILATGGIGQIYKHTTNASLTTGDGIALAYRSGARIINMEFTQFHPTTLAVKKANNFLITEALRGEKAEIVNHRGENFIKKYDRRGSLAPRDIVSRAIFLEQLRNKDFPIYLSLKKVKVDFPSRFPNIFRKCQELNIDVFQEGIPITPAFHFSCGGILSDSNGLTTINNLYAVGENACTGIHGANRLASTSLLEGVYFGYKAGKAKGKKKSNYPIRKIKEWVTQPKLKKADLFFIRQNYEYLKTLMWNYVGIIRKKSNLKLALSEINELKKKIEFKYHSGYLSKEFLELRNSVQVAEITCESAIKNNLSMGCHYLEN